MTPYERQWIIARPFLPVLYTTASRHLNALVRSVETRPVRLLDVGGRKSPYTIGLNAEVTILDIPRQSEVQEKLKLGVTENILNELHKRRSNIKNIVLEDMTKCTLADGLYDGVICVEVIEHIQRDHAFVQQIARVLKPKGWLFLTTPNGDYIRNEPPHYNPDHVRHYTREQLDNLLQQYFSHVQVSYGIKTGKYRYRGLKSLSPRHPIQTIQTLACNVISHIESRGLDNQALRTAHLLAVAHKE